MVEFESQYFDKPYWQQNQESAVIEQNLLQDMPIREVLR